jgi:hypothetical protein
MRKTLGALLAGILVLGGVNFVRPGQEGDVRAILKKAIEAAGGADNLAKHTSGTMKEKGIYYGGEKPEPYTGIYSFHWPDKFRMEIEGFFIEVVNGDKGWTKKGNETKEMTKEQLTQELSDQKAGWITTLLPLEDKAFHLKAIGETKVDKQDTLGVKVTRKDYPEVTLYFDKGTSLLVKSSFRTKSAEQKFKEVTQDNYYSKYRVIDGAKLPGKMVIKRDDKLFVEADVVDYKAGKVNPKVFARP